MTMDHLIAATLPDFAPLSLAALNAKAAMLERQDNKYILTAHHLWPALDRFRQHFDVLEIDGRRAFTYATQYFDDAGQRAYYDHHQGRRKRGKVRVRSYVDAGFSYLEVKLKDIRDVTIKRRLRVDHGMAALDAPAMAFVNTCFRDQYGTGFGRPLDAVIGMEYDRITLVAKDGGERMTIDTCLSFASDAMVCNVSPDMFIVETKSARGNGIADKILRGLHLHPTPRCSKYCIAMAALGRVTQHNHFLPALRRLHLLGVIHAARPPANPVFA
jgi:VTC domain